MKEIDLVRMITLVERAETDARLRAHYHPTLAQQLQERKRAMRLHQQADFLKSQLNCMYAAQTTNRCTVVSRQLASEV